MSSQIKSPSSSHRHAIGLNSYHFWHSYQYRPWIEVDLMTPKTLTGILIQGDSTEWVTSLQIKTGNKSAALQYITDDNGDPTVNTSLKYNATLLVVEYILCAL